MKPRLLELYCCAGGSAMGYFRAGFEPIGVDVISQPRFPFKSTRCDALIFLQRLLEDGYVATRFGRVHLTDLAGVHASPPCQHFTKYKNAVKDIAERYEDLLEPTRELLKATALPYVIENVEGAPLIDPVMLCGSMFDLDVRRHRLFETNWDLAPPWQPCRHKLWSPRFKSSTGRKPNSRLTIEVGSWDEPLERQKKAMGVDWEITVRELSEAVPPAFTEYIGTQLMQHLERKAA